VQSISELKPMVYLPTQHLEVCSL